MEGPRLRHGVAVKRGTMIKSLLKLLLGFLFSHQNADRQHEELLKLSVNMDQHLVQFRHFDVFLLLVLLLCELAFSALKSDETGLIRYFVVL